MNVLILAANILILLIGLILVVLDVTAIRYFQRQERIIGRNWVLHEYLTTAWVITVTYSLFLVVRIAVLLFSPQLTFPSDPIRTAGGLVTGVAFFWLGFKPWRQMRLFRKHEGRP